MLPTRFPLCLVAFSALLWALCPPPVADAQVLRPLPSVERIDPTFGPPGTVITLFGRYFSAEDRFLIGETQLEVVGVTANRAQVRVPNGAQTGRLRIEAERGPVRVRRFRVTAAAVSGPAVSGFEPSGGVPGAEVRIQGERFSPRPSENLVFIGDTPAVVRNANPTVLVITVPEGASSAPIRVEVAGAGSAVTEATFSVEGGLAVASFDPPFGPAGSRVTLTGSGFDRRARRNRVTLGRHRLRVVSARADRLVVALPRNAAGTERLRVQVGDAIAYSEASFVVGRGPVVRDVQPRVLAPGNDIRIVGAHFGRSARNVRVFLGGPVSEDDRGLPIQRVGEDEIVVRLPDGVRGGAVTVQVAPFPATETEIEVAVLGALRVTGFSPRSGPPGTVVTFTGQSFGERPEDNQVSFRGRDCEIVESSRDRLSVRIPEARSGTFEIRVANVGRVRTRNPFTVTTPPVVESFEPARAMPGAVVTIRGQHFGGNPRALEVWLGDRRLEVRSASADTIVAVLPEGVETGRLSVTVRLEGTSESPEVLEIGPPEEG